MRHLMAASKAAMMWLTLLCRSLVIAAIDSKDRRDERVQYKGHGLVRQTIVPVSCRPNMCSMYILVYVSNVVSVLAISY